VISYRNLSQYRKVTRIRKLTLLICCCSADIQKNMLFNLCCLFLCILSCFISRCNSFDINRQIKVNKYRSNNTHIHGTRNNDNNNVDKGNESRGFQSTSESTIPTNKVLKPSLGTKSSSVIEKFLMMYTCKICSGRNAQMVRGVLMFCYGVH